MCLVFPGIAVRTADEAARRAAALPAEAAQALEDCDGANLAALAPELLRVLELPLPALQEIARSSAAR